jgi:CheY-like chemotaxis protein
MIKAREDFLRKSSATIAALHSLEQSLSEATTPEERSQTLEVFYHKAHLLSGIAGLADCHSIARMASAFEALLFELMEKPEFLGPSVLRTIASTVDLLGVLFEQARESKPAEAPPPAQALVVDDDPISNRVIVAALRRADVRGMSTEYPLAAMSLIENNRYDLFLLDIEMPRMDGFELCKRIRALPGHAKTPVIYVTGHADFDHRAKSILSGGNDLISKPVFPIELAVKAASHIIKQQM